MPDPRWTGRRGRSSKVAMAGPDPRTGVMGVNIPHCSARGGVVGSCVRGMAGEPEQRTPEQEAGRSRGERGTWPRGAGIALEWVSHSKWAGLPWRLSPETTEWPQPPRAEAAATSPDARSVTNAPAQDQAKLPWMESRIMPRRSLLPLAPSGQRGTEELGSHELRLYIKSYPPSRSQVREVFPAPRPAPLRVQGERFTVPPSRSDEPQGFSGGRKID